MRNLAVLFIHFIAVLARLLGPGGVRSLIAESLLLKHQILILNRCRKRSPNLYASDRILAGLMALLVHPARLLRSAIVLKPSTLLALHKSISKGKYRMLFSPDRRRQPGPKGPSAELIRAVVEMKQRNPNWGCPRIAQQMALAFHIQIDKDVVRRILARHYRPGQDSDGPSWLTFLGQKREAAAPKASGCFMGGTCGVREEPGKQKPRSCRAQELARSRAQENETGKGPYRQVRIAIKARSDVQQRERGESDA